MEGRTVSHYEVMDRLGRGGMGEVYRARDQQLGRIVALKFLPPDLGDRPEMRERFLREARAASALDNPRICTVYEISETDDGHPFISMAYCPGETLKARMRRGPIPHDQARSIAIQIAEGLAAAHEAGVIHRDIKPANVMLTPGGVKILDFGLAKLSDATLLTQTGATMGTPAYMSPEQATGKEVDGRTDIWAVGAILYEMVTGTRPFSGDNATAIMYAILSDDPQPVRELRSDVPEDFERLIGWCLQREKDSRCPNFRAFLEELGAPSSVYSVSDQSYDLERTAVATGFGTAPGARKRRVGRGVVAGALAAVLVIAALVAWWVSRSDDEGPAPSVDTAASVADPVHVVGVAPFANRTGNPDFDWYGEGIAQLVTDSLSQSRLLQVIADPVDPATGQPRQELGLTAVVSGDIVPSPSGVAVAARIVETGSGRNLAAERVDDLSPENLLGCADEISAAARQGLGLPPEDTVDVYSADFAVGNPEAYRAYVQGLRSFADWRYEDAEREISQALALAPDFTMARYRLAWIYAATSRFDEAAAEMKRAAASSSGLTDREARYVRAGQAEFESRLDDALAEYEQLVELYPYDTEARHLLAGVLHDTGRYDEEVDELETLARLDPANAVVQSMLGYAHLERGDATQAVIALQRYVEMEPGSANGHHILGDAYRAQDELDLAAEEYRRSLEADPAFHFAVTGLASVEVMQGDLRAAEDRLRALVDDVGASPRARIDGVFDLASVLRAQGRFGAASAALEALESEIEAEQVREAMALAIRGASQAELGRAREAERLVDRAIGRSPGVATRYLFTRGLLELRADDLKAVDATAAEILEGALPPDDPDRTEDKASAYLQGMAALRRGELDRAVDRLALAVTLEGYAYAVYRLGLAEAFLAAGRLPEALAASRQAHEARDPSDPRLDLELDRTRALLTLAEVQLAMERPDKAAARAQEFLARWRDADAGLADLNRAHKLAGDR